MLKGLVLALCLVSCGGSDAQRPAQGGEAIVVVPEPSAGSAEPASAPPERGTRSGSVRWQDAPKASAEDEQLAEKTFQLGKELMNKGEYEAACDMFEQSLRHSAALGTLLNLAACLERAGRKDEACRHYLDALTWAKDKHDGAREQFVGGKVASLGCAP